SFHEGHGHEGNGSAGHHGRGCASTGAGLARISAAATEAGCLFARSQAAATGNRRPERAAANDLSFHHPAQPAATALSARVDAGLFSFPLLLAQSSENDP